MGKVALITGVNGQDGKLLLELLRKKKEYVKIVGLSRTFDASAEKEVDDRVLEAHCDVRDEVKLQQLFSQFKPDEIYHFAAKNRRIEVKNPVGDMSKFAGRFEGRWKHTYDFESLISSMVIQSVPMYPQPGERVNMIEG